VIPFALQAAVKKFAGVRPDENVCLLDIGAEFTDIVFMKGERLDLARAITTAGNAITEAMTVAITTEEGQLALDAYDAEKLKRQHGIPDEDSTDKLSSGIMVKRLATLQRPALERFVAEINRSIDYYRREYGESKIDRLLICGGTAAMGGLKQYIQTNLGIPTELFDPFRIGNLYRAGAKPEDQFGYRLVTALGLLYDHASVDLLPGEMRTGKSQSKDLQIAVVIGVLWVALLLVVYIVMAGAAASQARQVVRLDKELSSLKEEGREYFVLEKKVADLEAKQKVLTGIVGDRPVTVPLMARLTQVVPGNVQLNTFALSGQKNIKMTGVVSGEPHFLDVDLSQFMIDLEHDKLFKTVKLVSKNRTSLQGETVLEFEVQSGME